jgi:hypothetical protein
VFVVHVVQPLGTQSKMEKCESAYRGSNGADPVHNPLDPELYSFNYALILYGLRLYQCKNCEVRWNLSNMKNRKNTAVPEQEEKPRIGGLGK